MTLISKSFPLWKANFFTSVRKLSYLTAFFICRKWFVCVYVGECIFASYLMRYSTRISIWMSSKNSGYVIYPLDILKRPFHFCMYKFLNSFHFQIYFCREEGKISQNVFLSLFFEIFNFFHFLDTNNSFANTFCNFFFVFFIIF